jgi:ribosomal protein S18 acetylase RimI-like enzyme
MTEIRPMAADEATEMAQLWARTWREVARSNGHEPRDQDAASLERSAADFTYLLCTDPGASFVATSDEAIVGLATGLVRGDTYLLSHLCVAPELQDQGVGRQLLRTALAYGEMAPRGLICSSSDPRAVLRYVRAGFHVSPAMTAHGRPGTSVISPLRRSEGSPPDLVAADELDRLTRGVTHREDFAHLRATGAELWLDEDGAYALVRGGDVLTLAAASPTLAARALAALLSGCTTGQPLTASWLTDATPWAFQAAAEARARCVGWGALMLRGAWPAERNYLPSEVFG